MFLLPVLLFKVCVPSTFPCHLQLLQHLLSLQKSGNEQHLVKELAPAQTCGTTVGFKTQSLEQSGKSWGLFPTQGTICALIQIWEAYWKPQDEEKTTWFSGKCRPSRVRKSGICPIRIWPQESCLTFSNLSFLLINKRMAMKKDYRLSSTHLLCAYYLFYLRLYCHVSHSSHSCNYYFCLHFRTKIKKLQRY